MRSEAELIHKRSTHPGPVEYRWGWVASFKNHTRSPPTEGGENRGPIILIFPLLTDPLWEGPIPKLLEPGA